MSAHFPIYAGLLLTGLVMSLHCVGMCGPLIAGFAQALDRCDVTIDGRPVDPKRRRIAWSFMWYHAGRIWTYAMLGVAAGSLGHVIRQGSDAAGWHRIVAIGLGALVILSGLLLLGVVPGLRLEAWARRLGACGGRGGALVSTLAGRTPAWRFLLGAVMGFLPCGLVYAALAVVAALPSPLHAALGMIAFGIGTVPSLTAVVLLARAIPARWRAQGARFAAVIILGVGVWMTGRALWIHGHEGACHSEAVQLMTNNDWLDD
ncbi:MAG: hypothetical protein CMJ18_14500 [Phycisphaeraceae bacterium]|nr:hypothetical protein [Phycisphaeraceae bacterium]